MKIAVAMSGGIDSSVAAIMLKSQGHDITGITARFIPPSPLNDEIYQESVYDAKLIADRFGFPHYEFNFTDMFTKHVINYFITEYISGRTPNPCTVCNRHVKFSGLIQAADKLDCDVIATGHYAIKKSVHGRHYISMSPDRSKDQSYFLFMLTQEQLARSLFPLGTMAKNDTKSFARMQDLHVCHKPESQEICFIPDNDYISFIEQHAGITPVPGDIVDSSGKVIGKHNGIYRYTIGQRRGMGISSPEPLYVTAIDPVNNTITAGIKNSLYIKYIETADAFDMKYTITDPVPLMIKTRSTQIPVMGTVSRTGDSFRIVFDKPQIGISPGQCAVFYDPENDIVGGGMIRNAFN